MKTSSQKFQLQKSYALCIVFLFIHMGAIFCVCYMSFVFWGKIAVVLCVLAHFIMVIRVYVLRSSSRAILEFWQNTSSDWYLKQRSGAVERVSLGFPIFVSEFLIVLNFISAKKILKIAVPITKDVISVSDDFRKLKVLLKMTSANADGSRRL
jgi:hypothetical protein